MKPGEKAALAGLGLLGLILVSVSSKNSKNTPVTSTSKPMSPSDEAHLKKLRTPVANLGRQLLAGSPVPLVIVQSFRSSAEQAKLYAKGRPGGPPGPIVTNAKPGTSYHEYGLAFDVAVLKDGKPTWPNDIALWTSIGTMGEALGLKWGGRFPGLKDYGHFELHIPGEGPGQSQPLQA